MELVNGRYYRVLLWLTNISFIIVMLAIVLDLLLVNPIGDRMGLFTTPYVGLLGVLVGVKEVKRSTRGYSGNRLGFLFVVAWILLLVGLPILGHQTGYKIPQAVLETGELVIVIFIVSFLHKKIGIIKTNQETKKEDV